MTSKEVPLKMIVLPIVFCLLTVITNVYATDEVQVEDGILVLNKNNFKSVIDNNEFVFVQFFAPWCRHCKALAPVYVEVAKQLNEKESPIKLAKVDGTEESDLAEGHGVKAFPSMKLFKNGSPLDYKGLRKADSIIKWLLKKTGSPAKEINNVEQIKHMTNDNGVAIVGFFKDLKSEKAKLFLNIANSVDDHPFGVTSDEEILEEYDAEDGSIILFKKFDEEKVEYHGEYDEESIKKFISIHSLPLIIEFNPTNAMMIFEHDLKDHVLLFLDKQLEHYQKVIEEVRPVAETFRGQVLFVAIDFRAPGQQKILDFFEVKRADLPIVRLTNVKKMKTYLPETKEITRDNIGKFVQDYLDGKVKPKMKSEDLPEDWDKSPVKILVGTNFESVALDKGKDVLVEFYAPWCKHCKEMDPIYKELAEYFEENENVVIAKMDATANEVEDIEIHSYPTIMLFTKGNNNTIEFKGLRELGDLIKFVESGGVNEDDGIEIMEETENCDRTACSRYEVHGARNRSKNQMDYAAKCGSPKQKIHTVKTNVPDAKQVSNA